LDNLVSDAGQYHVGVIIAGQHYVLQGYLEGFSEPNLQGTLVHAHLHLMELLITTLEN